MSCQSRFNARYWMLGTGALGWPRGMIRGGRREEGSGWGTRVYLWWIHVDIWQNQYNMVKLKNKIKKKFNNLQALSTTPLPLFLANHYSGTIKTWSLAFINLAYIKSFHDPRLYCSWIQYVCVLVAHSCPNLCDPMDCSPPGSSVRGIPQARILEWVAMPFSMWI